MIPMTVHLDGDNCWPDLRSKDGEGIDEDRVIEGGSIDAIACLTDGMTSGSPSLCVRVNLQNGKTVLAQTSMKLMLTAMDVFKAKHGDPRTLETAAAARALDKKH